MTISEVIEPLEALAPPYLQEEYDNSGLLVGHWNDEVESALVCLDCTEDVVDEALEKNIDLIIAHHPIIFKGLKRFNGQDQVHRVVQKAIKNDIALYACHTNLDKVHGGVNTKIAQKVCLFNTRILRPIKGTLCKISVYCPTTNTEKVRNAMFNAGAGSVGNYSECSFTMNGSGTFKGNAESDPFVGKVGERHSENEEKIEVICPREVAGRVIHKMKEAHSYEEVAYEIIPILNEDPTKGLGMFGELEGEMSTGEFLAHLKNSMELGPFKYAGKAAGPIKKVAICGGSGSELIGEAIACGAQVLVTSDIKYHQFFDAEERILLIDIGHYESERYTIELIGEILKADLPKFAIRLTGVNTNPVQHYT